jgi:hypothetical protein
LRETLEERLRKRFKLTIIGVPRKMIIEVANLARKFEEEMPTPCRTKRSQPLSKNDDLDKESTDDEHKKEITKNHKEQDDRYQRSIFCQKCHNKSHLTRECKLL